MGRDCGLTGHEDNNVVLIPFNGPSLWAKPKSQVEERFMYNAKVAHIRARVEHAFARNRLGRFKGMFCGWSHELSLLWECAIAAMVALNVELYTQVHVDWLTGKSRIQFGENESSIPQAAEPSTSQKTKTRHGR